LGAALMLVNERRPQAAEPAPTASAAPTAAPIYELSFTTETLPEPAALAAYPELQKLDVNTHLYTSDTHMSGFPGRIWQVIDAEIKEPKKQLDKSARYSILSRNYPLSPEEIRKKYKLRDGDEQYLIAARHQGKPLLIGAKRMR
jgi:hypothetical protein